MTTEWTYIMHHENGRPVAETLPEESDNSLMLSISVARELNDAWLVSEYVTESWFFDGHWQATKPGTSRIVPFHTLANDLKKITPYAWQPWPEPAPYLESE